MIIKTIYQDPTGFTEEKILEIPENEIGRNAYELLNAVNEYYINENVKQITITKQP